MSHGSDLRAGSVRGMPIDDPSWPRADQWLSSDDPDPHLMVVGVPTSAASLTPSAAHMTPAGLRRRLARFSTYQGEWGIDLRQLRVNDFGDFDVRDLDMYLMPTAVEHSARQLPDVPLVLFLGGDNAVTRPLVKAQAGDGIKEVGLLTFDAHHDVRTLDPGPTNGSPVRGLVEDGLPGNHVIQVGIHSFANSFEYRRYCDRVGIGVRTVEDVEREGIQKVVHESLEILAQRCDRIYVDVDLDVLDRSVAPGCPGARPGGLSVRQLAAGVRAAAAHPKTGAMDFVEVDPERDPDGLTLDAAATVFLSAAAGLAQRVMT